MLKRTPRYLAAAAATLAASLLVPGPASARPASSATTAQGGVFVRVQTPVSGPYVNIAPHREKKASVSCRPGTRVTGGGGSGPGIAYLTDSYPAGNGWTVWAYNPGPRTRTLRAWAVCTNTTIAPGTIIERRGATTSIPRGANRLASVECPPPGIAIGGGGSGPGITYLTSSYPNAIRRWRVAATNPGPRTRTLTARVLCGPEPRNHLSVLAGPVTIARGQAKSATVTCPGSRVPISGGGFTSGGSGKRTYLTDSYPTARGWTVWAINTDSRSTSLTVVARCAR